MIKLFDRFGAARLFDGFSSARRWLGRDDGSNAPRRRGLARRAFLGGAGAALMLPWLESISSKRAFAADGAPKRILAYYIPDGIHMPNWRPQAAGALGELPTILAPLGDLKSKVNVISGLANFPARPDGPGDHASGTGAFLTVAHPKKTQGADIQNGISMDQIAAGTLKEFTRIPSLQVGIEGGSGVGDCDSGYSCAYARNISWASATQPLPKITSPGVLFDQIFQGFDPEATAEEQAKRTLYRTSVLDYVREDAASLKTRLGSTDRVKLDQYLTGVAELEDKIEKAATGPVCEAIDRPTDPGDIVAHSEIMNRLMTLAFQCDATRVITFMLANAGSNRSYEFLGISGGHHEISHHQDLQANFDKLTVIDTWEVQQFANLLAMLDAVEDIDGRTLLDNSMLFLSSEISDGNAHNHNDMPILLAGSGGDAFATGRHVVFDGEPSVAKLFIKMLNVAGVETDAFGDASGAIDL
ncbi:MAG: DUF1552 domain-containing protein [Polyangiaceae bacterium]|nr:DUF1552 domain-containing protein [Polyangiaceae bacterium]